MQTSKVYAQMHVFDMHMHKIEGTVAYIFSLVAIFVALNFSDQHRSYGPIFSKADYCQLHLCNQDGDGVCIGAVVSVVIVLNIYVEH